MKKISLEEFYKKIKDRNERAHRLAAFYFVIIFLIILLVNIITLVKIYDTGTAGVFILLMISSLSLLIGAASYNSIMEYVDLKYPVSAHIQMDTVSQMYKHKEPCMMLNVDTNRPPKKKSIFKYNSVRPEVRCIYYLLIGLDPAYQFQLQFLTWEERNKLINLYKSIYIKDV